MRWTVVLALAVSCGGCATVVRGTTDQIGFNSEPSGAEVHTSNGLGCVTPCTLSVKKSEDFTATFDKPGYRQTEVEVKAEIVSNGVVAAAGNAVVGGLIGIGVDTVTGAARDHVPNPVSVVLERQAAPAAPARKPRPAPPPAAPTS
jgi:hypothetical protein